MRIFLIGYMGSGKSTLGRPLARKLNMNFVDMDHYIESEQGMSIQTIFERVGESGFREIEKNALDTLCLQENVVISTGGGTPCFNNNIETMNRHGITVFLNISPEGLASRLRNAKKERPLIKDKTNDELVEFIRQSLDIRQKYYTQSKISINGLNITANDIIRKIDEL